MSLRVELHGKLTVSNDNTPAPTDLVFQSGDKSLVDSSTYNTGTGKTFTLPPSTTDHQIDLDGIVSCAVLYLLTEGANCLVTLVPTGGSKGACSAIKLQQNVPLIVPSDLLSVYVTNADSGSSAKFHVGAAGN